MVDAGTASMRVALVGNPNCGKTALFNRLTGSRHKVANYAGVTVERREGGFVTPGGRQVRVLDLPGAYSLEAVSPDEAVTRDVCRGLLPGEPVPDVLVCVADATNLRLHLRFILELIELGRPMVVALNMMDAAERRGIRIDTDRLSRDLGVPVVCTVAVKRHGAQSLVSLLDANGARVPPASTPQIEPASASHAAPASALHAPLANAQPVPSAARHERVRRLLAAAVHVPQTSTDLDEAIDRVVLHPIWGLAILALAMFLIFQAVFSWATPAMDAIRAGVGVISELLAASLPAGTLRSLLVDGVIAGAGAVLVFLPQILILFAFILVLEESGYLPRAAVLLDRFMVGAGLTGRSFIPLLSSFACAVPGIMAARTIQDPRDRLATILVAPLMTCSARLPVYALLIGAFIPARQVWGVFNLQGLVLFALYAAGIASAVGVASLLKFIRRDNAEHALLLELPSYRMPGARDLAIGLLERGQVFVKRVGTIILPLTVLIWFLASFPQAPEGVNMLAHSFAGRMGSALQGLFAPLGFTWEICIALVPGLAAREVAVGSLATVYAVSAAGTPAAEQLGPMIAAQWPLPTALSLLAWYVAAPMCVATLAAVRRETGSWAITVASTAGLFGLAYLLAFAVHQVALKVG